MSIQVVLVHGIRTSATMWRAQTDHLEARGIAVSAVDLPGHGTRKEEAFTLDGALSTIDDAVRAAASMGPVLLVGHSMGGLLCTAYAGQADAPPLAGFVAASCTAIPRGVGLAAYRTLAAGFNALPGHGQWLTEQVLALTLPEATRADFGAGGYAYAAQDVALKSLSVLDLLDALRHIEVPVWFVNGQYDQLRINERLFVRLVPHSELIVVPRATHLVTAMRPEVFNAVLDLGVATIASRRANA